ncbi:flagellin [Alishewanella jeotgali]|uniref:Flagellin n=1 Tax=Alishewanella jeotgali KCTC 22429 TaxID=1129374 RepID=H3ZBK7_9ALTE|nr:flagellin [Alishewanella jeotgali]EHR42321.1 flagellin domain-containing protein [Alishewanella jeotgali KCTC 22429]
MALFVNTNTSSLNAQRQLMNSGGALDVAFKRLSSGFRINSAADDAAGLQISNRLTSQINGLDQAARNANDGISMAQVAEGAMEEITTSLQRMRTLVVQSENAVNGTKEKEALQKEISALKVEVTRIAETTKFGDIKLLNRDSSNNALEDQGGQFKFLVGANGTTGTAGEEYITVSLGRGAGSAKGFTAEGLGIHTLNLNITDTDTNVDGQSRLNAIDEAIKIVDEKRADLGAVQNRFQATIRNLTNVSENVAGARARIRDTDFAKETAELTRAQILQQTSQTVLAQANQRPQAALSLLG